MRRFNICTRKTYTKNGEEKVVWLNVGTITEFEQTQTNDGGLALELNMMPEQKFYVFEQRKDNKPKQNETPDKPDQEPYEPSIEDIAF